MLAFLQANLATIVTVVILLGLMALAVRSICKNRKRGRCCGGCSGGCCTGCSRPEDCSGNREQK